MSYYATADFPTTNIVKKVSTIPSTKQNFIQGSPQDTLYKKVSTQFSTADMNTATLKNTSSSNIDKNITILPATKPNLIQGSPQATLYKQLSTQYSTTDIGVSTNPTHTSDYQTQTPITGKSKQQQTSSVPPGIVPIGNVGGPTITVQNWNDIHMSANNQGVMELTPTELQISTANIFQRGYGPSETETKYALQNRAFDQDRNRNQWLDDILPPTFKAARYAYNQFSPDQQQYFKDFSNNFGDTVSGAVSNTWNTFEHAVDTTLSTVATSSVENIGIGVLGGGGIAAVEGGLASLATIAVTGAEAVVASPFLIGLGTAYVGKKIYNYASGMGHF